MTQPLSRRKPLSDESVASSWVTRVAFQRADSEKWFSLPLCVHRLPPGLSTILAKPRTICSPISWGERLDDSIAVKRSHSSR